MKLQDYLRKGFKSVGTVVKNPKVLRKNGDVKVDITWNTSFTPDKMNGVYVIVDGDEVIRIGETEDIKQRFECFVGTHTGPSNITFRQSLENLKTYEIYFFELPVVDLSEVTTKVFGKLLLTEYKNSVGKLPRLNKVIQ